MCGIWKHGCTCVDPNEKRAIEREVMAATKEDVLRNLATVVENIESGKWEAITLTYDVEEIPVAPEPGDTFEKFLPGDITLTIVMKNQ